MWKSKTCSNFESCSGWNNGVGGSWTPWFLHFNKRGVWNERGDAKFGPFLMNVVAEITELWVENYQKINCRDVKSIWEGRVRTKCMIYDEGTFCSKTKSQLSRYLLNQSQQWEHQNNVRNMFKVTKNDTRTTSMKLSYSLLLTWSLTLIRFHTLFWRFHCWLWTKGLYLTGIISVLNTQIFVQYYRNHSFSTNAKFSEKLTFPTPLVCTSTPM